MSECSCDPRHLEIGGTDADCPVHDQTRVMVNP